MNKLVFSQTQMIFDADCLINIVSSGQAAGILQSIPCTCNLSHYVQESELLRHNIQPLIDQGLLTIVSPQGYEYDAIIEITFEANVPNPVLGDGEIETGAIGASRRWLVGIDDRKARRFLSTKYPYLQLISTPELIKYWVDTESPARLVVKEVLERVRIDANYILGKRHPLFEWWQSWYDN